MSSQGKSPSDLVAIVSVDEHGDSVMLIKTNRGKLGDLMVDRPLGTSVTFERIEHPAYGSITIPVIRRGSKQCDTSVMRALIKDKEE
jgi:hypothetical protein